MVECSQSIDRLGNVLGHAGDVVVVGPAVVTIEVAFRLSKQIGDERVELARQQARAEIGKHPAAHGVVNLRDRVVALPVLRKIVLIRSVKQLGISRKNGIGKRLGNSRRWRRQFGACSSFQLLVGVLAQTKRRNRTNQCLQTVAEDRSWGQSPFDEMEPRAALFDCCSNQAQERAFFLRSADISRSAYKTKFAAVETTPEVCGIGCRGWRSSG